MQHAPVVAAESEQERLAGWLFPFSDRRGSGSRAIWSPHRLHRL
jgi:hypothetical protein